MRQMRWWLTGAMVMSAAVAQAQIGVSDGGTPSYGYPIQVPPGIAGMAPKLSLGYGAGGVNGPEGYGWSVQGISIISRCAAIPITDGVRRGVNYAASDKLCLDGQRLIQVDPSTGAVLGASSQVNDAAGLSTGYREFRTEKDTYARVRAYGNANGDATGASGPAYFKVWTKSGQIYEYGASPAAVTHGNNALINVQGKTIAAAWAAARISDTVGNYIDFMYQQRDVAWGSGPSTGPTPGHEWNIAEIQYTGTASQAPTNKVIFTYADRTSDRSEAYHQGTKNVSVALLQSIATYINNSNVQANAPSLGADTNAIKVRTINLAYTNGAVTHRSLLNTITECAGPTASTCLPPTTFTYASGGNDTYVVASNFNLGST